MKFLLETRTIRFPMNLTALEALHFYRHERTKHEALMVVAAGWRENSEPGEEAWFEELGPDEFEDESFLEDFASATLQIWVR